MPSSILGDILEYQYLRHHPTFSTNTSFMMEIRANIEHHLSLWNHSLQMQLKNLPAEPKVSSRTVDNDVYDGFLYVPGGSQVPHAVLYAKHIYHCLYILVYSAMDFIAMFNDTVWQSSSDFLHAGEHANDCAKVIQNPLKICHCMKLIFRSWQTRSWLRTLIYTTSIDSGAPICCSRALFS